MRVLLLFLLLCLPRLAAAETASQRLVGLVQAGDRAAVANALAEAVIADAASADEPRAQRELFRVFGLSAPEFAAFTADWLTAEPDNPLALTAAGWQAHALAFDLRGGRVSAHTTAEALQEFRRLERKAQALFAKAAGTNPDLIAASDGLMVTGAALGRYDDIAAEIQRVMELRPNRGSLMRSIWGPQWGGGMEVVDFLCDRYADKIATVPDYDAQTCRIDAVYYANFPPGPDLDRAREALWESDNPILDHARLRDAIAEMGPAEARLAFLEDQMNKGPLSAEAARAYDVAFMQGTGQESSELPEFRAALPQSVADAEGWADLDPLNTDRLSRLYELRMQDRSLNDAPFDTAAFIGRLATLLSGNRYSAEGWRLLGDLRRGDGGVAGFKAAQPAYENALYYSRSDLAFLQAIIEGRIWQVFDQGTRTLLTDPMSLSPEAQAEFDQVVLCPLLRDLVAAQMLCVQEGVSGPCLNGLPEDAQIVMPLMEASQRHTCPALANGLDLATLLVSKPVAVDLAGP